MEVVQEIIRRVVRQGNRDRLVRTLAINLGTRKIRDREREKGAGLHAVDYRLDAISYQIASMLLERGYDKGLTLSEKSGILGYFQERRRVSLERAEQCSSRGCAR